MGFNILKNHASSYKIPCGSLTYTIDNMLIDNTGVLSDVNEHARM
jgi:hypothetical protein